MKRKMNDKKAKKLAEKLYHRGKSYPDVGNALINRGVPFHRAVKATRQTFANPPRKKRSLLDRILGR